MPPYWKSHATAQLVMWHGCYIFQRIDVEIERLTLDFDKYVENVNHESNDHLKEFVRGIYDNRKPAARVVMRDNHRNKRGNKEGLLKHTEASSRGFGIYDMRISLL